MVRILIADNCEVVRAGIRETLKSRPDCRVVAEADDGRRAISQAVTETPDIAIIELALPVADGIEVTARIRRRRLRTATLIFTLVENETLIRDALAPARGGAYSSPSRVSCCSTRLPLLRAATCSSVTKPPRLCRDCRCHIARLEVASPSASAACCA